MLDGSRPMFNLAGSKLPDEPAGGILTLDAKTLHLMRMILE